MKGVTIVGARLDKFELTLADGKRDVAGRYSLMGSNGVTMAHQSFNGYNDLKYTLSPVAAKALSEFEMAVSSDLNAMLGLL